MSLTLRDAQHLCWKTFRKLELLTQKNADKTAVKSELAKKATEISLGTQNSEKPLDKQSSAKQLSELLYLTLVLAEQEGIDLEESFLQTIDDLILGSVT